MIVVNGYIVEDEAQAIIFKAIQYYKAIESKELLCSVYSLTGEEELKLDILSKNDKKYASLFLAALTEDTDIKYIFNKHGITFKNILKYFKMKHIKIQEFSQVEYYKILKDEFQNLIDKFKYKDSGQYLYPEELIYNLNHIHYECNSNIIEWIFKYFKFENYRLPPFENPAMQEIKKSLYNKIRARQPEDKVTFEEIFAPVFEFMENNNIEDDKPLNHKNTPCRVLKFPSNPKK